MSIGHLSKLLPAYKRNFSVEDARAMPGAIIKFLARGEDTGGCMRYLRLKRFLALNRHLISISMKMKPIIFWKEKYGSKLVRRSLLRKKETSFFCRVMLNTSLKS